MSEDWASELETWFPGYLLPAVEQVAQRHDVAATFLERLSGNPDQLWIVRVASLMNRHQVALLAFATEELPALVRALPSWTEVERREWEGRFHGRLDVAGTLAWELRGQPQRFVTRVRRRRFDRPENVLVRTVAERLLVLLDELLEGVGREGGGWIGRLREAAEALRFQLLGTVLREVPVGPLDDHHVGAAQHARAAAYRTAADWARWLEDLDETRPDRIARLVAEAALLPASPDTRFELAVLLRLARSIEAWLTVRDPGEWRCERSCVVRDRADVVRFVRGADEIRLHYNQVVVDVGGPRADALRHYFGHRGRPRPDVTVELRLDGVVRLVVIEVKRTQDRGYAIQGFDEAWTYRWEYGRWLTGWPKAVLVTTHGTVGEAREGDDVVAVGWDRWVPDVLLDGLLAPALGTGRV